MESEKREQLVRDFATAINKVSAENMSNTPDFILAEYLMQCLGAFELSVKMRDEWYGVHLEPCNKFFTDSHIEIGTSCKESEDKK